MLRETSMLTFPGVHVQGNPIWSSYVTSDPFGKVIFWLLFLLSIGTWVLIAYKAWTFYRVRRENQAFESSWERLPDQPLALEPLLSPEGSLTPFSGIYRRVRAEGLGLLQRSETLHQQARLSEADLEMIAQSAESEIAQQAGGLEAHLYLLSTATSLAPFLGLLGTVWGILETFTHLQGPSASNEAILAGLSTALATTVLGLVIAIPALIGYTALRQASRQLERELERFSRNLLNALEWSYRV
jgi:biopolymer transport protein TolQ